MADFIESVISQFVPKGVDASDAAQRFRTLTSLLVQKNEKMNITAVDDPDEIVLRHYADSLLAFRTVAFENAKKIIDVGSGGGFPGLPVKICTQAHVTFLDSTEKKIRYIEETADTLGLENTEFVAARAEELTCIKNPSSNRFREKYDVVTARAVARLNILSELCLPFLKIGGYFVALKGAKAREELEEAERGISRLGGKIVCIKDYTPESVLCRDTLDERQKELCDKFIAAPHYIIVIKKISHTPDAYPRAYSKISKNPL